MMKYTYLHIYTYVHVYTHIYTFTYIQTYMIHTHKHIYVYIHPHTHSYKYIDIQLHLLYALYVEKCININIYFISHIYSKSQTPGNSHLAISKLKI